MPVQKIDTANASDFTKTKTFVVDTNVLYFIHSGYYSTADPCTITKEEVEDFLLQYDKHRYGPIDFFVVNNMVLDSHINFITDDGDFSYDANINVFTL